MMLSPRAIGNDESASRKRFKPIQRRSYEGFLAGINKTPGWNCMSGVTSILSTMATAKKSTSKKKVTGTKKNGPCWPGFEPVPGKKPGTKGSCKRIPGEHSAATRRATQRFAAADKLGKQGKPNPNR